MKLQLNIAIDGTVTGNVISEIIAPPTPTPTPAATPTLPIDWGNGTPEQQVARLVQWQFDHPEWDGSIIVDGLPYGYASGGPVVRFSTLGGKLHLEGELRKAAAAAGLSQQQFLAVADALPTVAPPLSKTDATKLWESVPSTLDPKSAGFLLAWMGGTAGGMNAKTAMWFYWREYYRRYGRQCTLPDSPRNEEGIGMSDARLAEIVGMSDADLRKIIDSK